MSCHTFEEKCDAIDAEPVDSKVEPKLEGLLQLFDDLRVPQVQVRLLGQEVVQVVLPPGGVKLPGRTPEDGLPVVWGASIGVGVPPHVKVLKSALPRHQKKVGSVS